MPIIFFIRVTIHNIDELKELIFREVLKTVDVGCMPPRTHTHRFHNVSIVIPSVPPTIRWRGASGVGTP